MNQYTCHDKIKCIRKVRCGNLNHKHMNMRINIIISVLKIKFQLLSFMAYLRDKTYTYNKI